MERAVEKVMLSKPSYRFATLRMAFLSNVPNYNAMTIRQRGARCKT